MCYLQASGQAQLPGHSGKTDAEELFFAPSPAICEKVAKGVPLSDRELAFYFSACRAIR